MTRAVRDRAVIALLNAGLRARDVTRLRRAQLTLGESGEVEVRSGLTPEQSTALFDDRDQLGDLAPDAPDGLLFLSRYGKPFAEQTICNIRRSVRLGSGS